MSLSSPKLRHFVQQALVGATGQPAPAKTQLASSFDLLCDRLHVGLRPLFGPTAVTALFARALHVATAEFPWLADVVPKDGDRCSLKGLERVIGTIDRDALEQGLAAVLAHELGLLSAFIGEELVMPLVQVAWEPTSVGPAQIEGDHD
jgi:hypothetical protein